MKLSSTLPNTQPPVARWAPIEKPYRPWRVEPNLSDYETARAAFSWEAARRALDGLPGGRGLNAALPSAAAIADATRALLH